ncbi:hypothetical protein NGRA_0470 [Nosema granulosis]|uniref:Uncharacterized protein n=1 Tax=Nosema granulosis TaxID=83296 RepID=A0A9P6KZJ3_9MICR|nr:hypothetical protein NGRA_0470 [Nosema granulosis]
MRRKSDHLESKNKPKPTKPQIAISLSNFGKSIESTSISNIKLENEKDKETHVKLIENIFSFILSSDDMIEGILCDAYYLINKKKENDYNKEEINTLTNQKYFNHQIKPKKEAIFSKKFNLKDFKKTVKDFLAYLNDNNKTTEEYKVTFKKIRFLLLTGTGTKWLEQLKVPSIIKELKNKSSIIPKDYGTVENSKTDAYIYCIINAIYSLSVDYLNKMEKKLNE